MTALQKSMANIYARQIHSGEKTLDDIKPQTQEYRLYVSSVYRKKFNKGI